MNRAKPENRLARVLQAEAARNGHKLPGPLAESMAAMGIQNLGAPQAVQVDTMVIAGAVASRMAIGAPVPMQLAPGVAGQIPMPDWRAEEARMSAAFDARHAEGEAWTADETACVALVRLLGDFQTREAAIRKDWNERRPAPGVVAPAESEALPEPPGEDRPPMRLLEDEQGHDANGSPSE